MDEWTVSTFFFSYKPTIESYVVILQWHYSVRTFRHKMNSHVYMDMCV